MNVVEVGIKLEKSIDYYDNLLKEKGFINDFNCVTHDIYYTNKKLDGLTENQMKNSCIRFRNKLSIIDKIKIREVKTMEKTIKIEGMMCPHCEGRVKKALEENKGKIMCVVAYVGDSRTMTIENLKEVHRIVKESDPNIWLHADACHGFSLGFSEKLKHKISGIELFDSISTDPHKVLAIPYCVSALLVKNPETFKLISSSSDLIMQEQYAWGQVTPFIGSKSWVSLKIWFLIKNVIIYC